MKFDNRKKTHFIIQFDNLFVKLNYNMEVKNMKRNSKTQNRLWTEDGLELLALVLTDEEK